MTNQHSVSDVRRDANRRLLISMGIIKRIPVKGERDPAEVHPAKCPCADCTTFRGEPFRG